MERQRISKFGYSRVWSKTGSLRRSPLSYIHRQFDFIENALVEEIDSAIDGVGYERFGLLHVMESLVSFGVGDDAAVLVRGITRNLEILAVNGMNERGLSWYACLP